MLTGTGPEFASATAEEASPPLSEILFATELGVTMAERVDAAGVTAAALNVALPTAAVGMDGRAAYGGWQGPDITADTRSTPAAFGPGHGHKKFLDRSDPPGRWE